MGNPWTESCIERAFPARTERNIREHNLEIPWRIPLDLRIRTIVFPVMPVLIPALVMISRTICV